MENVSVKIKNIPHQYDIKIESGFLENCGDWARKCLSENCGKIALVSNPLVFGLYGKSAVESLKAANFEVSVWLMKDGEEFKNTRSLEDALNFFGENNIRRTDAVVALGGGVVGDLAGFAASVYLRGISFLQIPTTLLSMIDSSIGGKTAVNSSFGKNLIGTFYQPNGVLVDVNVLQTLETRELVAGFCEAVKQGAISGKNLLSQTSEILRDYPVESFADNFENGEFLKRIEKFICEQISFKAEIVMQDEKESSGRRDAKSRKILNFGHTLAHALEKVTDYKYFKHGEAVGYGILFAAELSKELDILGKNSLELLNDVVHRVGNLPDASNISKIKILEAFAHDKKNINDSLQWILLEDIGKPILYNNSGIPKEAVMQTLERILEPGG